jgi:hypothetical protein
MSCCISIHSYGQQPNAEKLTKSDTKSPSCTCNCDGTIQSPAGVMTGHIHGKGQWMLSYTYQDTRMLGNRTGTTKTPDNDIYSHYAMAPESMAMQMHMVMVMYGVTDRLTVMGMAGVTTSCMTMNMAAMQMPGMSMPAMTMASSSQGMSDTRVYGLYELSRQTGSRIIASVGVNLPTGTVTATGTTMLGTNERLPYNMQPGIGSYSILPGITAITEYGKASFGADAGADIKANTSSPGYKWGNVYHANIWTGYRLLPFLTASVRAEGIASGKITGSDPQIAIPIYQNNDPTTRTSNYGGNIINVYAGLNVQPRNAALKKFTFLAEYGRPVYENLNGTQMALHGNLLAGLHYSF